MNCERCQVELEDLLYGELNAVRASAVKAHLAGCEACRHVRDELEREAEVFARYYAQTALEPSAEMWDAIRERISDPSPAGQRAGNWTARLRELRELMASGSLGSLLESAVLRQVAFAAVLVAVTVAATLYISNRRDQTMPNVASSDKVQPTPTATAQPGQQSATPTPAPQATPTSNRPAVPKTPVERRQQDTPPLIAAKKPKAEPQNVSEDELITQQVARAEREYRGVIDLLERKIARNKESLDADLVAQYQSSLALIDNSIAASRRALREHPKDPTAAQFLLQAYAKKVELMQEIAMR